VNAETQNRVALENDGVRLDIVEKVTGRAKYTADQFPKDMLWAAYIRSPRGLGRVDNCDVDAAKEIKGVLEVELTKEEGRYHGDRLGWICAETRQALDDAMAALELSFEHDRPRARMEAERGKPESHRAPDNLSAAEAALASAHVVHETTYSTQVQTHCCLEPHGAVVHFMGDRAIAWGSTQGTFSMRDEIADALDLKPDQVEFHCEYVGGGFGSKFGAGAEGTLAARMSKKFNKPVRVMCNRKEEQLDTGNRPGSMQQMKIGADKDGKLVGGRVWTWGSVGPAAAGATGGGGGGGGVRNPGRYRFGTVAKSHEDVNLNAGYPRAMRAPGHPQGQFAVEMMMDALAGKLGMDALQFRLLNDENENRKKMLVDGAKRFGWDEKRKAAGTQKGAKKRGVGVGVGDWGNGNGNATITINLYRNGTVEVLSGSQDIGQGFRTLLADIAHSHLGLPRDKVVVKVGQSSLPPGPGSGGSVTSRTVAPKVFNCCDLAKAGLFKLVGTEWNVEDTKSMKLEAGKIVVGDKTIDWDAACKLMSQEPLSFTTSEDGPYWKQPTASEAVQFVEVEVDIETGIVRVLDVLAMQEVGLPVNRHTIENQICGAVIQGMSFALFEDRVLDRKTGTMVNANMDMYKIAGPKDIPNIVPVIWRSREDAGVNSLGEPPIVPTAGAIACAVANAIGVQVRDLPMTPDRVLKALAEKQKAGTARVGDAR
jgi:xanthine dehydrogenase YagR molybdenum-binding subunit